MPLTDQQRDLLAQSVSVLNFSPRNVRTRILGALGADSIRTIGELASLSKQDIEDTPNLGKRSLAVIEEALKEVGLSLGMVHIVHDAVEEDHVFAAAWASYEHHKDESCRAIAEHFFRAGYRK